VVEEDDVHFVAPEGVSAGEWRFALMQPTARHVAAVCVRTHSHAEHCQEERTLSICAREVLPLVWDRELGMMIRDASHDRMAFLSKL
jgi:hypothetical protein